MSIYQMQNTVMHYEWGSPSYIPKLLKLANPTATPYAELWMGAHKNAPSHLIVDGKEVALSDFIAKNPAAVLGKNAESYQNQLPYLFKLLCAEKPLSIQAHPNLKQAQRGFEDEEFAKIPISDPLRIYKDPNHKPELICALTEFHAMCGFRRGEDIKRLFLRYKLESFLYEWNYFCRDPHYRIQSLLECIYNLTITKRKKVLAHLRHEVDQEDFILSEEDEQFQLVHHWLRKLLEFYPNDIGVLAPLYLNIIKLQPMEAIFLKAQTLHAYLQGVGMEIMANSDNVLRGGLTPKHIDLYQLFEIVEFKAYMPKRYKAKTRAGKHAYPVPVQDFSFHSLCLKGGQEEMFIENATIIFCQAGKCELTHKEETLCLSPGQSVFITPSQDSVLAQGKGTFFIASFL